MTEVYNKIDGLTIIPERHLPDFHPITGWRNRVKLFFGMKVARSRVVLKVEGTYYCSYGTYWELKKAAEAAGKDV